MIKICVERRKNEKTYLDRINHEVKDMLKTYLDRINHEVKDMLKTYLDRWNHESRESARPQSEEDGDIKLSTEDMRTLVKCFKGNEDNAIKFWKAMNQLSKDSDKTDLVNQLVKEGQINDSYKYRPLFTLLKKYGLYGKTDKSWYYHIK